MATAALIHHVFGIKEDVKDPVAFLDEQTVLCPAGHNTVLMTARAYDGHRLAVQGVCLDSLLPRFQAAHGTGRCSRLDPDDLDLGKGLIRG